MSIRGDDDWSAEKRAFDHSYRQTGKTTRLCEQVAAALLDDPELTVIITGAHVMRQEGMYRRMLGELNVDMTRVKIVASTELVRRTRGVRGKLFCDDFADLTVEQMRNVIEAERYLP